MTAEQTIHIGFPGESNIIHVEWLDENGFRQQVEIIVTMMPWDRPRTLQIHIDTRLVYSNRAGKVEIP